MQSTRPPSPTLVAYRLEVLADRLTLSDRIELLAPGAKEQGHTQVLLERHPELGDRVAGEIVGETFQRWPCCLRGLDRLTKCLVEPRSGQPHLRSDLCLRRPRSLVEEDLLVAACAAASQHNHGDLYSPPSPEMLLNDPLPPALDRDLESLLERPLAETHLHLGGATPPITFWLPLMLGLLSVEQAAVMAAEATAFEHREVRSRREVTDLWICRLLEAGTLRWRIAASLPRWTGDRDHPFKEVWGLQGDFETDDEGPEAPESVLKWLRCFRGWLDRVGYRHPGESSGQVLDGCPIRIDARGEIPYRDSLTQAVEKQPGLAIAGEAPPALGERYLLAGALRYLRGRVAPDAGTLRADLLRYIRIKNAFLRLLVHYRGIHGLDRFRHRFARNDRGRRTFHVGARGREVWLFACIRYQVRMTVLRWLAAGTRQRLLPEPPTADERARRTREILRESVRDLERRLELRLTPGRGTILGSMLFATAQGVRDALRALRRNGKEDGASPLPRFQAGLVLHLVKSRRRTPKDYEEILNGALLWFDERPAWRPLLVGVDAAGSELDSPPSSFAAAFGTVTRWRAEGTPRRYGIRLSLGKTFHVGEDFRDLLTGVRQVDMAIRALGLSAGDRLGHALAVGLDPELWYQRRGRSFPRLGDHLLDLLWAWDLLGKVGDGASRVVVESRLQACGVQKPSDLVDVGAWLAELVRGRGLTEEERQAEVLSGRDDDLVEVPSDGRWIETLACLQRLVSQEIDRRGLTIEANPTSNYLICGIDDFSELPLFRQHPVRVADAVGGVPLSVSVSTDDPEVFRVSLREEYGALFETARKDRGRSEVLRWLERLRTDSFESSFLTRESPAGENLLRLLDLVTDRGFPSQRDVGELDTPL